MANRGIQLCFVIAKADKLYVIGAFQSAYGGFGYAKLQSALSSKDSVSAKLGSGVRLALAEYYVSAGIETEISRDVLDELGNGQRARFIRHASQVSVQRLADGSYLNEGFFAYKGTGFTGLQRCANTAPEDCPDEVVGARVIELLSKIERIK